VSARRSYWRGDEVERWRSLGRAWANSMSWFAGPEAIKSEGGSLARRRGSQSKLMIWVGDQSAVAVRPRAWRSYDAGWLSRGELWGCALIGVYT
jgi:hypothetical protein